METLDLRGLKCPLPALLARRALAALPPGTRLAVTADDPLAALDIPHMCHGEGHGVESTATHQGHTAFVLVAWVRRDRAPEAAAGAQDG